MKEKKKTGDEPNFTQLEDLNNKTCFIKKI